MILAGIAIMTSIGTMVLLAKIAAKAVEKDEEETDNNETNHPMTKGDAVDSTKEVPRFPWEPAAGTRLEMRAFSASSDPISTDQQNQQLELLASMTFANGGFRPPSCPCCQ